MYILHYTVGYFDDGGIDTEEYQTLEEVYDRIKAIQSEFPEADLQDFTVYQGRKLSLVPTQRVVDFIIK